MRHQDEALQLPALVPKEAAGISAWIPSAPKKRRPSDEGLPEMEEIAYRIASRYSRGLNGLEEDRQNWRKKHNLLMQRKLSPNSSAADLGPQMQEEIFESKARKEKTQKNHRTHRIRVGKDKQNESNYRSTQLASIKDRSNMKVKEQYMAEKAESEDEPGLGFQGLLQNEFQSRLKLFRKEETTEAPSEAPSKPLASMPQEGTALQTQKDRLESLKKQVKEEMDSHVEDTPKAHVSTVFNDQQRVLASGGAVKLLDEETANSSKPKLSDPVALEIPEAESKTAEAVELTNPSHEEVHDVTPTQDDGKTDDQLQDEGDVLRTLLNSFYQFAEKQDGQEDSDATRAKVFVQEVNEEQVTREFLNIVIRAASQKVLKEIGKPHEVNLAIENAAVETASEGPAFLQPVPPPGPGPAASRPQPIRSSLKPVQQDGDAPTKSASKGKVEIARASILGLRPVEELAENKDVSRVRSIKGTRGNTLSSLTAENGNPKVPRPSISNKRTSVVSWARPSSDLDVGRSLTSSSLSSLQNSAPEVSKVKSLSFEECVGLGRKHRMKLDSVRQLMEEFLRLDNSNDGTLSMDEFKQAIRDRCNIPAHKQLPAHLMDSSFDEADTDNDGMVSFEEFLVWSSNHAFSEELVVSDPQERYLRSLARKHHFGLIEVERCHKMFKQHDTNKTGYIEESEFRLIVAALWGCDVNDISAKRLRQFWLEADASKADRLIFEDFLTWFIKFGSQGV